MKRVGFSKLKNQVLCEDVISVLKSFKDNSIDMIYGDPDYNVGINYSGSKYQMKWDEYIEWYTELAKECLRVMKKDGNGFMINYSKQNSYLRVKYLDEHAHVVHDYSWVYNTNVGHSPKRFTTAHRSILHFTKSKNNNFYKEQVAMPYKNPDDRRIKERIANGHTGRMPYSWFYFDLVKNVSKDKTFHACQIPLPLFELLLKSSTKEGNNVFILFGGSGSEIMSALKLKRDIVSCELNKRYHEMITDRINSGDKDLEKYRLINVEEDEDIEILQPLPLGVSI